MPYFQLQIFTRVTSTLSIVDRQQFGTSTHHNHAGSIMALDPTITAARPAFLEVGFSTILSSDDTVRLLQEIEESL